MTPPGAPGGFLKPVELEFKGVAADPNCEVSLDE